jgi:hypothetical protein
MEREAIKVSNHHREASTKEKNHRREKQNQANPNQTITIQPKQFQSNPK